MELDDLKTEWEKEMNATAKMTDFTQLQQKADKLDRWAKFGWRLEFFGALFAIPALIGYVWFVVDDPHPFLQISTLMMIAGIAHSARMIHISQKVTQPDDWTLLSRVNGQIEKRQKEVTMLTGLAQKHLLPMFLIAAILLVALYFQRSGSLLPDLMTFAWLIGMAIYMVILHFVNRNHLNNKVHPMLEQLQALKRELEK